MIFVGLYWILECCWQLANIFFCRDFTKNDLYNHLEIIFSSLDYGWIVGSFLIFTSRLFFMAFRSDICLICLISSRNCELWLLLSFSIEIVSLFSIEKSSLFCYLTTIFWSLVYGLVTMCQKFVVEMPTIKPKFSLFYQVLPSFYLALFFIFKAKFKVF